MEIVIKINIDKDRMNYDGKSINNFDFKAMKNALEDIEYVKVESITHKIL